MTPFSPRARDRGLHAVLVALDLLHEDVDPAIVGGRDVPAIEVEVTGGGFTEPLPLIIAAMGSAPNDGNMRKFLYRTLN